MEITNRHLSELQAHLGADSVSMIVLREMDDTVLVRVCTQQGFGCRVPANATYTPNPHNEGGVLRMERMLSGISTLRVDVGQALEVLFADFPK